jgi:hypothetical protein
VVDTFSRKSRKDQEELRSKYDDLEDKYETLQSQHERQQEEADEKTNIRISNIEVEIESMNQRVEKLATDSYAIHSEVREIHESVTEMQVALRDIVGLYKAVLTKYSFGNLPTNPTQVAPRQATQRNGDPGDDIIEALKRDAEAKNRAATSSPTTAPRSRTVAPRPPARPSPSESQVQPSSVPSTTNALDELHRISEAQRNFSNDEPEVLAGRLASRSAQDDRVGKVARRDVGRMEAIDRDTEGEFTRSLPKKSVIPKLQPEGQAQGGGWEATAPPDIDQPKKERKPRPRLEDLLSPE